MGKMLLLLFFLSIIFFIAVLPGNHSEAEDAFEYSRLIEEGQGAELFHPHHLLYLPLQKGVFKSVQVLGYDGRSYYVARAVSMFSGAVALLLFFLVACRFGGASDGRIPFIATLGLLFSYGFVRYACEVEIYLPAMALALAAIYSTLRKRFIAGICFAALAVLMHTINMAVALVVIPLIYLVISKDWKRAVLHGAATLALIGLVYGVVQNTSGLFSPPVDSASEGWLQPGTVGKAIVGFGQCVLSANFIFAYEIIAEKLQAWFPYRVFSEELFAAAHMPRWLKAIAPLTFILALAGLVGAAGGLFFRACRRRAFDRIFFVLLLWLGGTLFPTLMLEPSNPELWILALAPLWMLFLWFAAGLEKAGWLAIVVCLLGVHNIVAGMGFVKDQKGDYNFRKSEWVLQHAEANDMVHTADSYVFSFYLTYWGECEVRNVNSQDWKLGSTTYLFDDVFCPPSAVGVRYPDFAKKVLATAQELKPQSQKAHDDQFGGIWIVEDQNPQ